MKNIDKLSNALSALVSSIFTNILYAILSDSVKVIKWDSLNSCWNVVEIERLSKMAQLVVIVLVFVVGYFIVNHIFFAYYLVNSRESLS